jgi:hypothetical protein
MAYLNAQLSLFEVKFKGDKFPKSAEELLGKSGSRSKPYSDDQWRGLAKVLEMSFGED